MYLLNHRYKVLFSSIFHRTVLSSVISYDLYLPLCTMNTLAMPSGLPSAIPTKLLPGRPALMRKRTHSEDASSPSLAKKSKVSFSSNVEIRVVGEWEKPPELIQEEVGQALEKHARGDESSYLDVKAIYSADKRTEDVPSTTTLRNYTAALLSNVSSLNKSRSDLVYAVLNSPWLGRSEEYTNLYIRFLANLVSAHGVYLADALRMLVENLTTSESSFSQDKIYNPKMAYRSPIAWPIVEASSGFTLTNPCSGSPSFAIHLTFDAFSEPYTFNHTRKHFSSRVRLTAVSRFLRPKSS